MNHQLGNNNTLGCRSLLCLLGAQPLSVLHTVCALPVDCAGLGATALMIVEQLTSVGAVRLVRCQFVESGAQSNCLGRLVLVLTLQLGA